MTLPVRTVVRLLKIKNNDLESVAKEEDLLKPKSPSCGASFPLLLPDSSPSACKTYYKLMGMEEGAPTKFHSCCPNVVDHPNATCPCCGTFMTQQVVLLEEQQVKASTILSRGYVKGVVMYMDMDDLEIKPMSTISSITKLNQFDVKDVGALKENVITIGMNEAVELLKTLLYSNQERPHRRLLWQGLTKQR